MQKKPLKYLIILILTLTSGCPSRVPTSIGPLKIKDSGLTPDSEAEKLFELAVEKFERELFDEALNHFMNFSSTFNNEPVIHEVFVYIGRIHLEKGDTSSARSYLEKIPENTHRKTIFDYAQVFLGFTDYNEEKYEDALLKLEEYSGRFADEELNYQIVETLLNSSIGLKDIEKACHWAEVKIEISPGDNEKVINKLSNLIIHEKDQDKLLSTAKKQSQKNEVWAFLIAQAARNYYEQGNFPEAANLAEEIKKAGIDKITHIAEILSLIERITDVDMRTIGCILPLSGNMRLIGESTLKGIMLAAKRFRFGEDRSPLSVSIRDTQGNPEIAVSAIEELVKNEKVSAIIGPMDLRVSAQAAQKAQSLGVPIILLSTDTNITAQGDYIFRHFASNNLEAISLVKKALKTESTKGYAILYPDNAYGRIMKNNIEGLLKKNDKILKHAVSFEASTKDFAPLAKELNESDFDILFLPLTSAQLALAAPALSASGIWPGEELAYSHKGKYVHYLIPSIGYSETILNRSGRYLQGALFVENFSASMSTNSSFFRRYENEYRENPTLYAAYAHDATFLIADAVRLGVNSRVELKNWLQSIGPQTELAMPFNRFSANGDTEADLKIMRLTASGLEFIQ